MSHTAYSTFRTPQQSKQRRSFLHGGGGPASPAPGEFYNGGRPSPTSPNFRSFSEGRHSEGMYAKPSFKSPVSPVSPSQFPVHGTVRHMNSSPSPYQSNGTLRRIPDSPPSNDSVRKVPSFLHMHHSAGVGFGGGGGGAGTGVDSTASKSKLGNGFNTLPASMHRGVRLYDPLNNVNRFQRRSGEGEDEAGSLNNFEFYRNRQGTGTLPRGGGAGGGGHNMSYQHSKVAAPEHPMGMRNKPAPENKPSLLLSPDENRFIFEILGRGRQTLATAVGRLLTPTPDQQQWQVKDSTGAVCLVRDTTKKSYFIQVFSLRAKNMIFRQEIYNQFEYQMPQATFMTFEGDSSMVAILFADSTEASNFREALDGKLEAKRQRRNERETRKSRVLESQVNNVPSPQSNHYASNNNVNTTPPPSSYPNANGHTVTTTTTYNFSAASAVSALKLKKSKGNDKKDNKKKTKLTAKDIGTPMDFRHVQHVGWDPTKGFDLNLEDKDLRTFFEKAGVSANQLNDENTRKFIYNFIEQHGVVDIVKRSANNTNTPTRAPPPVPPSSAGSGPPPVPTRMPSIPNSNYPGTTTKPPPPPPPPSRPVPPPPPAATYPGGAAGPPPPPMRTTSSAIQNSPTQYHHHPVSNGPSRPPLPKPAAVNGPSSIATPPPPPPPPMPTGGAPPPPPPPPPPTSSPPRNNGLPESNGARSGGGGHSLPPVVDERSQLMKQIQKGVQLKKVEVEAQPKRVGGISDCLSEIQKGVDLKPVPEQPKGPPNIDAMDGLAGALARALADRQRALNPDSSSSDDEDGDEYDEEEWE